jgi:hypothetical protein
MSAALTRYDDVCRSLQELNRVDEAKEIVDKAAAMLEYARRAKDRELIGYATNVCMRAQIRAGELLAEMGERGERDAGKGGDRKSQSQTATVKLSDLGVTKNQSSRWQKLAALPKDKQEAKIRAVKEKTERAINPPPKDPNKIKGEKPAPKLNPASWAQATSEECRQFVKVVRPREIVAAVGAHEFYRALTEEQKDALWAAEQADQAAKQSRQSNGKGAHP